MARKREPQIVGTYWGIKDGKVDSVNLWTEASGVYLTWMSREAVYIRHPVMRGRSPDTEVVVVFSLSNIIYLTSHATDEDKKRTREKLEAIIAEKGA